MSSVARVTEVIAHIAASAREQSDGIALVNDAIAQLDQATQQNAALVEESAAAAQKLREQAYRLAQAASTFRWLTPQRRCTAPRWGTISHGLQQPERTLRPAALSSAVWAD